MIVVVPETPPVAQSLSADPLAYSSASRNEQQSLFVISSSDVVSLIVVSAAAGETPNAPPARATTAMHSPTRLRALHDPIHGLTPTGALSQPNTQNSRLAASAESARHPSL